MLVTQRPNLYILHHPIKGRCIHTADSIPKDELIEICPVIILSKKDLKHIHKTKLHDYYFLWGENRNRGSIALGYGSLYNHSENPNAKYELDLENDEIRILSIKKIESGSEITISYIDKTFVGFELWFDPVE